MFEELDSSTASTDQIEESVSIKVCGNEGMPRGMTCTSLLFALVGMSDASLRIPLLLATIRRELFPCAPPVLWMNLV